MGIPFSWTDRPPETAAGRVCSAGTLLAEPQSKQDAATLAATSRSPAIQHFWLETFRFQRLHEVCGRAGDSLFFLAVFETQNLGSSQGQPRTCLEKRTPPTAIVFVLHKRHSWNDHGGHQRPGDTLPGGVSVSDNSRVCSHEIINFPLLADSPPAAVCRASTTW